MARETVSKIQQIRKNNNFEITDRVVVYYNGDLEYKDRISNYIDFIKDETLAVSFVWDEDVDNEYDINEYKVNIKVLKA